jgi:superfamily II DNA or RNA helicase
MTICRYWLKDPDKAYVSNNIWLPKRHTNGALVKAALTFTLNEEEPILDELGEVVRTKQKTLELWDETETHIITPREFIAENNFQNFPFEFERIPTPKFKETGIEDLIELRDEEQRQAYEALLRPGNGTLHVSCGRGKTVIALKVAATLKVPTIVIVNSTALLEQWKEEIHRHLKVTSIGIIQGTVQDWKGHPIVIAMVHTLSNRRKMWTQEFKRYFGLAIYDEAHHMSAPVFVLSADMFYGKRVSLTATAFRTDGLEVIYQHHLGKVIHRNLTQDLIPRTVFHILGWQMPPDHRPLVIDCNGEVCMPRVRTYLGRLEWRNNLIYKRILQDLAEGRQLLVLSHSVNHVGMLHDYLSTMGSGVITGETAQDSRMGILRNANPVFGTFQLAREGLNKPCLDTLYVVTPFSNSNDLQQAWGRIQRRYEGKKAPLVRVFEDTAFSCCVRSCRGLRNVLKKFGYPYTKEEWERNA